MELKEYLRVIKKHKEVFLVTWGLVCFFPLFIVFVQPVIYEGEKTILITRESEGGEVNVSEKYDYYYQLESDGKFAEMVVKFLEDKALLNKIFDNNNLKENNEVAKIAISKEEKEWIISNLEGETFGNGYVKIKINSHSRILIEQISGRLISVFTEKVSKVGIDKSRAVKLMDESVVIAQKRKMYLPVGLGAFFGGLLVAIFTALGIHYWKEE